MPYNVRDQLLLIRALEVATKQRTFRSNRQLARQANDLLRRLSGDGRLRRLHRLGQLVEGGGRTVDELARRLGVSRRTVFRDLIKLRQLGYVLPAATGEKRPARKRRSRPRSRRR